MMNRYGLVALLLSASAAAQATHTATIWIQGPDEVLPNSTYTAEVWGSWDSPSFIDGVSAMAGFGIDVHPTQGIGNLASVSSATIASWAAGFGSPGYLLNLAIIAPSGGQIPNVFGLNPGIEMGHPLMLYSFEFTTNDTPISVLEFSPMNPNLNGGLAFYPVSTNGASIVAPNDAGTQLNLVPWTYRVPAPGTVVPLCVGLVMLRRRR